jgi:hypothetical protein
MARDEAHASHIGGQCVDLFDSHCGLDAIFPASEVEKFEFIGECVRVLRVLQVDTSHPVALCLEKGHEVVSDEATSSRDQRAHA